MLNFKQSTTKKRNPQGLPTSATENRTPSGKRKPLTNAHLMYFKHRKLNEISFQRTAQIYYKTNRIGKLVTLKNEITNDFIKVNFNVDEYGYMSIYVSKIDGYLNCLPPVSNTDLFIKIISKRLL